ncbi:MULTISPECIES: hypothetical protein [Leuconostoc]|uniref:50S ribosomal protein L20 n=2 Tax=Leuconostoc kimchii TaxID=136609 RepID=D5T113_LEUKI|nr:MULTISPECIES: hypothetical protein [Leuconostoc]ADG39962.1 50S ribosomal protein L20 [Leuconostoc kimchii IMSNU 11154]QBR47320.1 hypothetical protein EW139_03970 [Leuconostoc kimchii]
MQRKPFKKSHRARNIVIATLIAILVIFTIFAIVGHNQQSVHKIAQTKSTVTSKTKRAKSKSSHPKSSSSTTLASASESTSVAEAPVTASSAVSSVINTVTNDATQTPITDNSTADNNITATSSSDTNSESVSSGQVQQSNSSSAASTTFGNWSASTYDAVAIGTVTYDEVRATYGNPTYLTASDQLYATWQSTSGAKVAIVFTPTGDANNLKLVASSKSQSGLQ